VERLLILTEGDEIAAPDLAFLRTPATAPPAPSLSHYRTLQEFRESTEKQFLVEKLREHDWNISATAKAIDTPRSNLYKKLEYYGLSKPTSGSGAPAGPPGGGARD
jgi:two-component system nitrogen regulation response regulator NtrX